MQPRLDTAAVALDILAAPSGDPGEFGIEQSGEVLALLKRVVDGALLVNLNGSDGTVYGTRLRSIDTLHDALSFSVDAQDLRVRALVEADDVVAVAYLDNIKIQFQVLGLVLVHGAQGCVLSCALPEVVYRFQRRANFRVKPVLRAAPVVRLRHPMIPDMALALRVLDVSIAGCALFLPDDVPTLQPGVVLNGVQLDLDVDTRIGVSLRLQHVTSINPESRGVRLGCEMVDLGQSARRTLQRYIDHTQKRQRFLSD